MTREEAIIDIRDNIKPIAIDCISRQAVLDLIADYDLSMGQMVKGIHALPSVTPQPQEPRWIPVSEKLPDDRNWYLGIFKEPDTGWVNPLPFICDYVGKETKATTKGFWILRGLTDCDSPSDYYLNLECVAWMPLPESYCTLVQKARISNVCNN